MIFLKTYFTLFYMYILIKIKYNIVNLQYSILLMLISWMGSCMGKKMKKQKIPHSRNISKIKYQNRRNGPKHSFLVK